MKMIGICGPKGSGKSTVSKIICDSHILEDGQFVRQFVRHRFAGPLKEGLKAAFGLTDDHVDGHLKEEPTPLLKGHTPRHAMITFGTEWGRNMIHPDIWITAWKNTMPDSKYVVVDDVRFPNEIEMLRQEYGAIIIRISRPGHEHDSSHESEAHGDLQCDLEIRNTGDMGELKDKVFSLMRNEISQWIGNE